MSFSLYISYVYHNFSIFKFGLLLVSRTPILGLEVPCTIHCTKRRNYGGSGRIRTHAAVTPSQFSRLTPYNQTWVHFHNMAVLERIELLLLQ